MNFKFNNTVDVLYEMSERNKKALLDAIANCEEITFIDEINPNVYRKYYINFDECNDQDICCIFGISIYADKFNEDGHLESASCGGCNSFAFHMEFADFTCNFRSYYDDRIKLTKEIIEQVFVYLSS